MTDYATILSRKYFGSQWELIGNDYSGLNWKSETPKPSKKQLDDLWAEVQSEIQTEAQANAATRAALLTRLGISEEEARILLGGN